MTSAFAPWLASSAPILVLVPRAATGFDNARGRRRIHHLWIARGAVVIGAHARFGVVKLTDRTICGVLHRRGPPSLVGLAVVSGRPSPLRSPLPPLRSTCTDAVCLHCLSKLRQCGHEDCLADDVLAGACLGARG
jgi:hypothetical protein